MNGLPELTAFDLGVIAVVLVSAILALARGFTRELMTLVTWGGAIVTAYLLWDRVHVLVAQAVAQPLVVEALTAVLAFLVPLIIYKLIAGMIVRGIDDGPLAGIDRILGFVFGIARGVFIVAVVYLVGIRLVPAERHPDWVRHAWLLPRVQTAALALDAVLPADFADRGIGALERGAGRVQDLTQPGRQGTARSEPRSGETGYDDQQRSAMERLMEKTP